MRRKLKITQTIALLSQQEYFVESKRSEATPVKDRLFKQVVKI